MAPFFLVGSWDDWTGFWELTGEHVYSACIEVRQPPGVEEFQILQDKDWKLRFCPSRDGTAILGPQNAHGANWRLQLPPKCKAIRVAWDPRGCRTVTWRFLGGDGKDVQHSKIPPKPAEVELGPFFLAGSWNGWRGFTELKRLEKSEPPTFRASVKVSSSEEQFQIVRERDWHQRYYPSSEDGIIEGPSDKHGTNWRVEIPGRCTHLEITWVPTGKRSVKWGFPGGERRHNVAAKNFADLMLEMRAESPHGRAWLAGMQQIFQALPTCQRLSPYGERAEPDATARCLLATLSRDSETLRDARGPAQRCQHEAFVALSEQVDKVLAASCGTLDHSGSGGDWMQQAVPRDSAAGGDTDLTLFQRLTYLPLVMYVRNTVHLYEMLDRLKAQARGVGSRSTSDLRGHLDGKGTPRESPYSWLIFGIMGALQTLARARAQMGQKAFPLELLASSPPQTFWLKDGKPWEPTEENQAEDLKNFKRAPCDNCQPMQPLGSFRKSEGLMYRGIWLPPDGISEDSLRLQYSFQSFSRCIQGVTRVLRFYSSVSNTKAQEAAQGGSILIYVARGWPNSPWVMPVQLFDGPKKKEQDSEEELLMPPFMVYEFESDLNIDGETDLPERQSNIQELEERWGVQLPEKLTQFVIGLLPNLNHTATHTRGGTSISMRFIKSAVPSPHVVKLFEDPGNYLYEWGGSPSQ